MSADPSGPILTVLRPLLIRQRRAYEQAASTLEANPHKSDHERRLVIAWADYSSTLAAVIGALRLQIGGGRGPELERFEREFTAVTAAHQQRLG